MRDLEREIAAELDLVRLPVLADGLLGASVSSVTGSVWETGIGSKGSWCCPLES